MYLKESIETESFLPSLFVQQSKIGIEHSRKSTSSRNHLGVSHQRPNVIDVSQKFASNQKNKTNVHPTKDKFKGTNEEKSLLRSLRKIVLDSTDCPLYVENQKTIHQYLTKHKVVVWLSKIEVIEANKSSDFHGKHCLFLCPIRTMTLKMLLDALTETHKNNLNLVFALLSNLEKPTKKRKKKKRNTKNDWNIFHHPAVSSNSYNSYFYHILSHSKYVKFIPVVFERHIRSLWSTIDPSIYSDKEEVSDKKIKQMLKLLNCKPLNQKFKKSKKHFEDFLRSELGRDIIEREMDTYKKDLRFNYKELETFLEDPDRKKDFKSDFDKTIEEELIKIRNKTIREELIKIGNKVLKRALTRLTFFKLRHFGEEDGLLEEF